jgi:predicted nucleotidyltransferase
LSGYNSTFIKNTQICAKIYIEVGDFMKAVGIICEYNPFHNGHLYHLNKVKELCPDHVIILILGGNFLQRGEPSIINKWDKTKLAIEYGVDLVVELPFAFATQSADLFAAGSISLLDALGVDKLVFGSETNDIDSFTLLAKAQLYNDDYDELVKGYLSKGVNYPTALSNALFTLTNKKIDSPNDILGISYVREIIRRKSNIKPICIKRTNNYHDKELNSKITSATSIREALKKNQDISNYVPKETLKYINKVHNVENYYPLLKYKILSELDDLDMYQTVDEGIENRIKKFIIPSKSYNELVENIKTKRYTYNKIGRMFTHILCNFSKDEADSMKKIRYIRVLGFSVYGQSYLNENKKRIKLPIITNYSKLNSDMLALEFRSTCVYASILNEEDKQIMIEAEYKNKPIIK